MVYGDVIYKMCKHDKKDKLMSYLEEAVRIKVESWTLRYQAVLSDQKIDKYSIYRKTDQKLIDALPYACQYGYTEIVEYILKNLPIVKLSDVERAIGNACVGNHINIVEIFIRYNYKPPIFNEGLRAACLNANFDCVKLLVEYGVDIHHDYDYPLRAAFYGKSLEIVVYLLKHGANYNTANEKLFLDVKYGYHKFDSDVMLYQLCNLGAIHGDMNLAN